MNSLDFFLIDATAFCYRAFYAVRGLATSYGQPTNAIFGFLNILQKMIKEYDPAYLAVCFDVSRDTFRQKKFAEYKVQRPPMPDGLTSQMPYIKELVEAYQITLFEKEGFEADDIIATIVKKAKAMDVAITIVSADKDMLQLVDERTRVLSPAKENDVLYDVEAVKQRFGVGPERICDILALAGDDVDNIPGVPGVGEKTAIDLLKKFQTLEALLAEPEKIAKEKLRAAIIAHKDRIILNKELAALDSAVDVDFSLEKVKRNKPDERKLFRLFKQLEFKSLLKGLVVEEAQHDEAIVQELSDQEIQKLGASADTLVVAGEHLDDLVLYLKGTFFKQRAGGKVVQALLADAAIKKSGHDLKKIKVGLAKEGIVCAGLYFDTLIAAHLLNPALPDYKLTDLAWTYLGTIDSAIVIDAQKAARLVVELQARLEQELQEKSLNKLFSDIEMPLVEVLAEMEIHGVSLDLPFLASLSREIEKRLSVLVSQIYALSGGQFNLNSPKQLREVLFERLALPVSKRSKTGPSTDEEVLRSLASQHALPKMLLEYRQLTKLKNTYIDALPALVDQATGKLHTSFNQTVTETGRLSSTHPNLQNIPVKTDIGRQIRKAFIAPAENLRLVSCDYSQIELRILAHLSKDAFLIDAFKHGKDIHTATAALLHGIPEQEVDTTMREMAKRVNFGIVYGLSAFGLARDLEIPVTEAQAFIDAYFLRYPGVKEYIDKQIQFAQSNGFVMTMFSRRRYLPEINNKNQSIRQMAQRQAINTPIQGSASDLIKLAMIQIHQQLKLRGLSATMILQIHDELVFEVPAQEMPELTALVKDRMENVLALDVPIRVAIKQGKNWLEMEEMK